MDIDDSVELGQWRSEQAWSVPDNIPWIGVGGVFMYL